MPTLWASGVQGDYDYLGEFNFAMYLLSPITKVIKLLIFLVHHSTTYTDRTEDVSIYGQLYVWLCK